MGRQYFDPDQGGRPDPGVADRQAVADGVAAAYSVIGTAQQQARDFFVTHGVDALPGHQPVPAAAQMGDVDVSPDAADSGG
jgi:hypothetical protein